MSRASPFPTRRARSPSQSSANVSIQTSFPTPSPRFPQPSQSPSPQTSNNSPVMNTPFRGQAPSPLGGPSRPQRSELRSRLVSEHSISEQSSNRDSVSVAYSDVQQNRPRNGAPGIPASPSGTRSRSQRTKNVAGDSDTSPITPTLSAAVSAFQNAGARKRSMTNGSDDAEQERNRERERELQAERLRQQRIQDRIPGRRANRKAKAGDIDGRHHPHQYRSSLSIPCCPDSDALLQRYWTRSRTSGLSWLTQT